MPDLNVTSFTGLNGLIEDATELRPGAAADGTQNIIYENGIARTTFGFDKVLPAALPLDSGNNVLGFFNYGDVDSTRHLLAITRNKIYDKDNEGSTWADKTQSGVDLGANIFNPVSHASILHTDGLQLNGSGDEAFKHSLICPGVQAAVQRWAGKFEADYTDLLGADGYHDTGSTITTHFARQVGSLRTHVLLISAKEADANDNLHTVDQRIRWGAVGKLETYSGTGTGYVDLFETGGTNIWGATMGNNLWIQYQNNSIWSLIWVGGTTVFRPNIEVPSLGLLSPHLLAQNNNIHYFVGTDFNVYEYQGGTNLTRIGNNIQRYLERDLNQSWALRCWMIVGPGAKRIWIFIVNKVNSNEFATEAYIIDTRSGAWTKRDFTHKWITAMTGITAAGNIGSGSFEAGPTYSDILGSKSPSKVVEIGGCVRDTNVVTTTTTTAHGFIVGETVVLSGVDSGSEATAFSGSFTIASKPSTTTFTHAQTAANESNLAEGTALVDKSPTYTDYANAETTYREMLTTVLVDEAVLIGDDAGYVYQFDLTATDDDSVDIPCRHISEVLDGARPNDNKVWPQIHINAKGTSVNISYRVGNFETTATGWVDFTEVTLTSEYVDYAVFPNVTSKKIQFKFWSEDDDFMLSKYTISQPALQGEA